MKKLLPIIFTTFITPSVYADESWYLGGLYNAQEISPDAEGFNSDFSTFGVLAGYRYNKYFALEARVAKGTSGYSSTVSFSDTTDGSYQEDINSQISLLVKASYPIYTSLSIYGLAGYTRTEVEVSGTVTTEHPDGINFINVPFNSTHSVSGLSYGVGLNYQFTEHLNIYADYQNLPDFEPVPSYSGGWKSTTIGVNYSF